MLLCATVMALCVRSLIPYYKRVINAFPIGPHPPMGPFSQLSILKPEARGEPPNPSFFTSVLPITIATEKTVSTLVSDRECQSLSQITLNDQ